MYYDIHGEPITQEAWLLLFTDKDYCRVAHDNVGKTEVSTVWMGLDHGAGNIFETMVFEDGPLDGHQRRYKTREEAEEGHDQMVKEVQHVQDSSG